MVNEQRSVSVPVRSPAFARSTPPAMISDRPGRDGLTCMPDRYLCAEFREEAPSLGATDQGQVRELAWTSIAGGSQARVTFHSPLRSSIWSRIGSGSPDGSSSTEKLWGPSKKAQAMRGLAGRSSRWDERWPAASTACAFWVA